MFKIGVYCNLENFDCYKTLKIKMDFYKFYSTDDCCVDKKVYDSHFQGTLSRNAIILDSVLKKILDYEQEIITLNEIPDIISKFQEIKHSELRSPVYFTLAYIATIVENWDTVWILSEWLSKWIGVPLEKYHIVRYYRFLTQHCRDNLKHFADL